MSLIGKQVAILGVGRSGRAAAVLALREGATVSVWDAAGPEAFEGLPETVEIHPHATEAVGSTVECDLLVVSPGIDTYGPYVAAFSKRAGEVIGEVELASRYYPGRIIGITGTNGKTTTTELIERILAHAGLGGTACGNYGVPFAEVALQAVSPAAVSLELSSFQLETVRSLRCSVAVWLNFAPDHMDRYPTVESYRAAKLRIFETQQSSDVAIIRSGEGITRLKGKMITFSTTDPAADWYSTGKTIVHGGETWLDLEEDTALRGLHNAENAMAALAACNEFGISQREMREALRGYAPPPHRCELVRTLDEVEYLNDSKATNLHALECALRSQTRPVVLIAGGKEKGLDYAPLISLLSERALAVVTFGQIARPLGALFSRAVPCEAVVSLADAVATARGLAPRGSTILFSPGTSSFDQFTGYEQRGNTFRDLVHQLR
jgi:UDP-N-acetylmuramoylalanine--D-glutamate ligase